MTWKEYCERPERVWHKFSPINSPNDDLYAYMTCNECTAKLPKNEVKIVPMGQLGKHFDEHEGIFTDGSMVWTK